MRKVFLLAFFALFAWNILANAQESERYIGSDRFFGDRSRPGRNTL